MKTKSPLDKDKELEDEIEKLSKNKIWVVKVTTVDLETGNEYEIWNQVFYNEEDRENFIIKNKWENEEKYSVERQYYENVGSEKINLLKAELKGRQESRKELIDEIIKIINSYQTVHNSKGKQFINKDSILNELNKLKQK